MTIKSPYADEISEDQQKTPMPGLTVKLTSAGNPDRGQNPYEPLYGVPNGSRRVATLKEASKACQDYIAKNELGGGNWTGGDVYQNGRIIARVSYNGRVWNTPKTQETSTVKSVQPAKAPRARKTPNLGPSM